MTTTSTAAAVLFAWSAALAAQIKVETETLHRVTTRIAYRNSEPRVSYRIAYGTLKWRNEYASVLEAAGTSHFRLGTGPWAELDTNAVLTMGDTQVAAGRYYLGIQRRAPGDWALTLMQAEPLDRRRLEAGFTSRARPDVTVPLQFAPMSEAAPELVVELLPVADAIGHANLRIRFGTYRVETPVVTTVHERPKTPAPKFEPLDRATAKTTASGLVYQVVRAGKGEPPKAGDSVIVHYTGWLADGTPFDSSHDRGEPTQLPVDGVIRGWQEGLGLMAPGAVYKLSIPPALGYGENQMGPIPTNSTLVFQVELIEVLR